MPKVIVLEHPRDAGVYRHRNAQAQEDHIDDRRYAALARAPRGVTG
mgnify:CR=1 FL=1